MRKSLFWKILIGFWITFIVITQAVWLVFYYYAGQKEPFENRIANRIVSLQFTSAVSVLETEGIDGLNRMTDGWPTVDQRHIAVIPLKMPLTDRPGAVSLIPLTDDVRLEHIRGGDGEYYLLKYDVEALRKEYRPDRTGRVLIFNMPPSLLVLGAIGGFLFSAVLAWNLTRPMRQMRSGFDRVAQGDLDVRLYPVMKNRRDELGDMARDFDSMVERLKLLVGAREALLHDVSHELRTPLARLQLAIGLARQNPQNVENELKRIELESERLDKMIGELLTLSRTDATGISDEEYFDLYGLLEAVVSDVTYEAQVPGVEIALDASEQAREMSTVKGNSELMRRAVENIIRNALRFSKQGQRIEVGLFYTEGELLIQVNDQGPGVDEDKLSSIFDPFVRVKSASSGKGYGLGLAIARKVVNAHGGTIEAKNRQPHGLSIGIRLPAWQG
ncbi:sensor histidine kinase [Leminorella grimontii]|uniref:histidine kinase n=1 Tax=Leminorella grimontii TaxID=82981 RepID=A0AAV5N2A7_9GAMM|nr:ATP-binding protein [Leminorella grimontii]KFC97624.1 putative two-component system sensor kinase [Leminorella grimontii ATCC 33999 = DSM 5078]GKX55013.1 sensor histidine kinase [Leminorella grimontii]GKX58436.1 sensor histidine kinase [Leminorella grimontii]VFS57048.1 Sensor protein CpxA [Leminorella grimontii]